MTLIFPYYENPEMLIRHCNLWQYLYRSYDTDIIIVDDGSPNNPALPLLKKYPHIQVYRVLEDIPWNQHGARNLGAKVAKPGWLYLSDMDLLLPLRSCNLLNDMEKRKDTYYQIGRKKLLADDTLEDKTYHCNTYLLHSELYWKVGGYDEDYCGTYGGDGQFDKQLQQVAKREFVEEAFNIYHPRDRFPDAATSDTLRDPGYKVNYRTTLKLKNKAGDTTPVNPVRFQWERQQ